MLRAIILLLSIFMFIGCKTRTVILEVPVETVKILYVYKLNMDSLVLSDSVYIHDSIYIKESGDTVYLYIYKTLNKIKYRDRIIERIDSFIQIDSIPLIVEIERKIEVNKLNTILKGLVWVGGIALFLIIGILVYKVMTSKIWK